MPAQRQSSARPYSKCRQPLRSHPQLVYQRIVEAYGAFQSGNENPGMLLLKLLFPRPTVQLFAISLNRRKCCESGAELQSAAELPAPQVYPFSPSREVGGSENEGKTSGFGDWRALTRRNHSSSETGNHSLKETVFLSCTIASCRGRFINLLGFSNPTRKDGSECEVHSPIRRSVGEYRRKCRWETG